MQPDLKLVLDGAADGSHVEILVWHQIMLNASPYFQKMLAPGRFAQGTGLKNGGLAEIALPDTSPWAMTVLCDIFHLRTRNVPVTNITSDQLFEIGVLVDRFDCADVVEPWSRRWMEQKHIQFELHTVLQDVKRAPARDLAKWICICRSNGRPSDQDTLESALIIHHTVDDLMRERQAYADYLSPSLIDRMRDMRSTTITEFHAIMVRFADFVEQGDSCLRTGSGNGSGIGVNTIPSTSTAHTNSISNSNSNTNPIMQPNSSNNNNNTVIHRVPIPNTSTTHSNTHTNPITHPNSSNTTTANRLPNTNTNPNTTLLPHHPLSDRAHHHDRHRDNDDTPTTPTERFHCSSINLGNFMLAARTEFGPSWRALDTWTASIATTYHRMQEVADRLTGPGYLSRPGGGVGGRNLGSTPGPVPAPVSASNSTSRSNSNSVRGPHASGMGGVGGGLSGGHSVTSHEACSLKTRFLAEIEDASRKLDSR